MYFLRLLLAIQKRKTGTNLPPLWFGCIDVIFKDYFVFLTGTTGFFVGAAVVFAVVLVFLCFLITLCFLGLTFFTAFGVAAVVLDFVVAWVLTVPALGVAFVVVVLFAAKALPAPVMSRAEERMAINVFFVLNKYYTPFVVFVDYIFNLTR
jgi:hypothetical protein